MAVRLIRPGTTLSGMDRRRVAPRRVATAIALTVLAVTTAPPAAGRAAPPPAAAPSAGRPAAAAPPYVPCPIVPPHAGSPPASVQKLLLAQTLLPRLDPAQVVEVVQADLDFERGSSAVGLLV